MSRTYRIDPLHPFRLVCTSCAEAVLDLPPGPPADVPTGELTRQQVLDLWPDLEDDQADAVCEHDVLCVWREAQREGKGGTVFIHYLEAEDAGETP
jgi:hypothetical protein